MSVELRAGKVAYVPVKCRRSRLVALRAFGRDDGSRSGCIVGQMFSCRVSIEVEGEESARWEGGVEMGMVRGRDPNALAGGARAFQTPPTPRARFACRRR